MIDLGLAVLVIACTGVGALTAVRRGASALTGALAGFVLGVLAAALAVGWAIWMWNRE